MPSVLSINKALGVLLIAAMAIACGNKKQTVKTIGPHKIVPEEVDSMVGMLSEPSPDSAHKLAAKVKGKLSAPYMLRYQRSDSPYAEFPRTLHVDFYNDSMQIESQVDAHYGKYYESQGKIFLKDSVVVKNILKKDTVHCRTLWWDQRTERFTTDDPVRIYTPDKILYGTGMEADQNFRWYTIKKMTGMVLTQGSNIPGQ